MFWDQQEVVIYQNGYHSPYFRATRGTTQGGLISPTLFSLIVNNVLRNWITLTVEYQLVAHEGLGLVLGVCLGLFYVDNVVVGLLYPEWIQGALNVLICLVRGYRMLVNVTKSKAMTCQSGTLQSGISEEALGRQCT